MSRLSRRALVGTLAGLPLAARADVPDAAGRAVAVPARVARVFPAGPPAATLLYTLAPDLLAGWTNPRSAEERAYLLPETGAKPEVGRITGRGNTANLEAVLAQHPDLILDVGATDPTYVSLADRVQAQTGIPYALLDGRLARTPETYRTLGRLLRREARAEELAAASETILRMTRERAGAVPAGHRARFYYARGPRGLETARPGSINLEAFDWLGARNVVDGQSGLATVSLEQVLAWDPEVVVTLDPGFARAVRGDPAWASVSAVRSGRVHLSPRLPFGWVDFPPSVNRLLGLPWLGRVLYPDLFADDLRAIARDFHARFYGTTPTDAQLDALFA